MNLNPFDLRGPEFLFFYAVTSALLLMAARTLLRLLEPSPSATATARVANLAADPYAIAYLRGGQRELLMVSLVSLLERGFIKTTDRKLLTAHPEAIPKARRPLDKAILARLPLRNVPPPQGKAPVANGVSAALLLEDDIIAQECGQVGRQLEQDRFLPDQSSRFRRQAVICGSVGLLWFLAFLKVQIALERGRTNVLFLVLLAIAVPFVFSLLVRSPHGQEAAAALAQVKGWYGKLYDQRHLLKLTATTSELTYLAAVFGYDSLPDSVCEILAPLPTDKPASAWLQSAQSGNAGSTSSCGGGSSCSGGSSCGGGGGCGGCGGS